MIFDFKYKIEVLIWFLLIMTSVTSPRFSRQKHLIFNFFLRGFPQQVTGKSAAVLLRFINCTKFTKNPSTWVFMVTQCTLSHGISHISLNLHIFYILWLFIIRALQDPGGNIVIVTRKLMSY